MSSPVTGGFLCRSADRGLLRSHFGRSAEDEADVAEFGRVWTEQMRRRSRFRTVRGEGPVAIRGTSIVTGPNGQQQPRTCVQADWQNSVVSDLPSLGFGLPVAGSWARPDVIGRTAGRAEALGYSTLWTFQRILHPVDRGLPATHLSVHDSAAVLAYAAAHTGRIGLGTATMCALLTPPAFLAKTMASLDVLSGGRITVGVGMGWMPEEFAVAGVPFEQRGARMDEYLRCLGALWTEDPVEFEGEFYTIPRSHTGPLPVQRPHPPVLLGGAAPAALLRAGRLANGWIGSSGQDLRRIAESVQLVREGAIMAGRDPEAVRIVLRGVPDITDVDGDAQRRPLQGTRAQVMDDLVTLKAEGVTEVFFDLNLSPRVGSPEADPKAALDYAESVLEAFARTAPSA